MITCKKCGVKESPSWWKCCPTHTSQRGPDCVCQGCANLCFSSKENDGKTTGLIEDAVSKLADLPEGSFVFVTGAHTKWLHDLEARFKTAGLNGIVFLTPSQIINGALRGRYGILLIDDFWDLPGKDAVILAHEQRRLRHMIGTMGETYGQVDK